MALKVPSAPTIRTIAYTGLLGHDLSQHANMIDRRHSPDMLNMISDEGGNPVKRKGWEIMYTHGNDISDLYSCSIDGDNYIIFITRYKSGTTYHEQIYSYSDGTASLLLDKTSTASQPRTYEGFTFKKNEKDVFYLFGSYGIHEIKKSGNTLTISEATPTVPTVLISKPPSGQGGTPYQDINLLTTQVIESFLIDQDKTATVFNLALTADTTKTMKLEYLTPNGTWAQDSTARFANNRQVSITSAHANPLVGNDSIRITYHKLSANSDALYYAKNSMLHSTGSMDRVFLTNSEKDTQRVWYSMLGDPLYFPDLNYVYLGSDGGDCKGFLQMGENIAVVKSEKEKNHSTIYQIYERSLTSTSVTSNTADGSTSATISEYNFAVRRVPSSNGAIASEGFAILGDEPLFLSGKGLYGLSSLTGTAETVVRNRSVSINKKLLAEADLENTTAIVLNNYLYLFVGGHVYVFDGRRKSADPADRTNYYYEAYYWDNIPADHACVHNAELWFSNGNKLCRFKNTGRRDDYSDGSSWNGSKQTGGTAITARYTTRNDDDNAIQMFKTMMKKGSMVALAPYTKTSVKAYARRDGKEREYIGTYRIDSEDASTVPFADFSADATLEPSDYFFRKKKKKYIRLQLIFENDSIDEPFGIFSINKSVTATQYGR